MFVGLFFKSEIKAHIDCKGPRKHSLTLKLQYRLEKIQNWDWPWGCRVLKGLLLNEGPATFYGVWVKKLFITKGVMSGYLFGLAGLVYLVLCSLCINHMHRYKVVNRKFSLKVHLRKYFCLTESDWVYTQKFSQMSHSDQTLPSDQNALGIYLSRNWTVWWPFKHYNQKHFGEERVYFSGMPITEGSQGRNASRAGTQGQEQTETMEERCSLAC